jgi:hypothetical protein
MSSFTFYGIYQRLENWHQWRWSKLAQGEFDNQLVLLSFSPSEWQKIPKFEGGREIQWQGTMYDVASLQILEDKVLVRALADEHEDALNAALKKCHDAPKEESVPVGWWNIFGSQALLESNKSFELCPFQFSIKHCFFFHIGNSEVSLTVPHEPPRGLI